MNTNIGPVRRRPGRRTPGRLLLLVLVILSAAALTYYVAGCRGKSSSQAVNAPSVAAPSASAPEPEQKEEHGESPKAKVEAHEVSPEAPAAKEEKKAENKPETTGEIDLRLEEHDSDKPVASGEEVTPKRPQNLPLELRIGSSEGKRVALTFDAGASAKPTPSILATLKREGVHATFFLTGKWVAQNPDLTREIAQEGHVIGNHSYSHPDFRKLSPDEISDQLDRTEKVVEDTAGISTKPYFRPPFGGRDNRVLNDVSDDGYRSIYWTVDSWDGFKKGITPGEIKDRVLTRVKPGAIVLMHCGSQPTAEALPQIIDALKAQGYTFVTVSDIQ